MTYTDVLKVEHGGELIPYGLNETETGVKRSKLQRLALMEQAVARAQTYAPVTLRQLYYLLVNSGWLAKTEHEYKNLGGLVTKMRRGETDVGMDWDWIIDAGRYTRTATTWSEPRDILRAVTESYRRSVWQDQSKRVWIGVEKEALAAVFQSIADEYAVPVVVAKGYPSATYQHDLALELEASDEEVTFFYYGDHDPSGDGIADLFREIVVNNGGWFERSALTAEQITERNYLTRPPKLGDSRTKNWDSGDIDAADVDAIPPDELRDMIRDDIYSIIDLAVLDETHEYEEQDIERLRELVANWVE